MGIIDKVRNQNETPKVENTEESKLTQSEIEFVLVTLRESTFKGTQVVDLYNTVLKLQQQHKNLSK